MTDPGGYRVYVEPLSLPFRENYRQRKADGIIPTLGGQMALNLARNWPLQVFWKNTK